MFPILNIGPLAIQFPGLLIILGVYFSLMVAEKNSPRFGIKPGDISNLMFLYFLSTIIIGRLVYILQFPGIFFENPLSIISINPDLIDFNTGLLFSIIVAYVFIQRKNLNSLKILDALLLPALVFMLFFFLSQLASGNNYGKPTDVPWAIELWGTTRHPLQIYYFIGTSAIIAWVIQLQKKTFPDGILFIRTSISFLILVVFMDYFNGNPDNVFSNFNLIQVIAWIFLCIFIFLLYKINISGSKNMDLQQDE